MSYIRSNIVDAEWSDCLSRLRDARALVLRDAESFHQAAMALERVGQILCGKIRNGLGAYENELLELAKTAETMDPAEVDRLFAIVKEARNMAVHEGAWARHLSSRLVDFFIILEKAIMNKMTYAQDIMVRQPMVAEMWHLVAHVRQTMLANSFSSLPVLKDGRWHCISDLMIMRFLHSAADAKDLKVRLSTQLEVAISAGGIVPSVASCYTLDSKLVDIVAEMQAGPALVIDCRSGSIRLVGILTPFDLL